MNMKNIEIIDEIAKRRNIKDKTKKSYETVLNQYSEYNGMTLEQLLKEADTEEEKQIRMKKRKINERLTSYRDVLFSRHTAKSAYTKFTLIKTFYKTFQIELPELLPINKRNINSPEPIKYSDLLDHDIIKKVLDVASPLMSAVTLFMASSGCAIQETVNLTIGDFIKATSEEPSHYHDETDIKSVIDELFDRDDVVPTFYVKRQKTEKYYYTFCSPEATHYILAYLKNRENLDDEAPLFDRSRRTFIRYFESLNNKLNLGKKGSYNRFRSHMLRKFHSNALKTDGMHMEEINAIQGKGKGGSTNEAYFMDNPAFLKKKYVEHMDCLCFNWKVNSLDVKSPEFISMERDLSVANKRYDDLQERINGLEDLLNNSLEYDDKRVIDKYFD